MARAGRVVGLALSRHTQALKRSSMALTGHQLTKLKRRFRADSVYVGVLVFNSKDMRILLTSGGLLPSATVTHDYREVCNARARVPRPMSDFATHRPCRSHA